MNEGYIPSNLADEISPPPRETPDAWIVEKDGLFFILALGDGEEDDDDALEPLLTGAAVKFMRLETFPDARLMLEEDGTFTVDPPAPEGAEQVMIWGETDSMDDSVQNLVENFMPDPGEHELQFYTWHDEVWTFDGGKFTRGAA